MRPNDLRALSLSLLLAGGQAFAQDQNLLDHTELLMDHGGGHLMDWQGGMVMGQNKDTLPGGCDKISEDREITVRAGRKYAKDFPGRMYGFDQHEWRFKPCTRLTVHFINEDKIRHQFMMHGLPKYIYPLGMFHLEVTGPAKISGTLILPGGDATYLVHCDLAQHMEKGMKAQVITGDGGGDLPSIPGLTDYLFSDAYPTPELQLAAATGDGQGAAAASASAPELPPAAQPIGQRTGGKQGGSSWISGMLVIGLAIGLIGAAWVGERYGGGRLTLGALQKLGCDLLALAKRVATALGKLAEAAAKLIRERSKG